MTDNGNVDWSSVEQIYQEVVDLPLPDRLSVVQEKCKHSPELMQKVVSLLANTDEEKDCSTQCAPSQLKEHSLVGKTINKYTLVSSLGAGGMGHVYEATTEQPKRTVAFKLFSQVLRSRQGMQRFKTEIEILGNLSHPNIATMYDAGTWDDGEGGVPWFAMELVTDSRTIIEYCANRRPPKKERLKLFLRVCEAVVHAHQKGIIHRDLKPSNILVDKNGQVKIIDFGIARVTGSDLAVTTIGTSTGQIMGTIAYMSPEQCRGDTQSIDLRSDVYSLGIVLYELLTGSRPFDLSKTTMLGAAQMIQEGVTKDPRTIAPNLPTDLATIILKAIEKEPDRRYQSTSTLADDVKRFLDNEPIIAAPPSVAYKTKKFIVRNKLLVGSIASILFMLLAGTFVSVREAVQATKARTEAQLSEEKAIEARTRSMIVSSISSHSAVDAAIDAAKSLSDSFETRYALSKLDQSIASWDFGVAIPDSAITPDGKFIVSALTNSVGLGIIDVHTNEPPHILTITDWGNPHSLAIGKSKNDSSYLVAALVRQGSGQNNYSEIVVFSLNSKTVLTEKICTIPDIDCRPLTMAFLHDSQELIVVTKTGTIELWEIDEKNQSSTKIASVLSTGSGTLGVAISHDDSMFAQSNSDSTTHLWNIDSLRNGLGEESLLAILSGHRYKVMDPAFSLDDKMLATAGIDTTIRLWNIEAAIEEATLNKDKFVVNAIRGTLLGHSLGVTRVAFLRHDQLCSVSIDKTIRLWNVDSDAQPCKRIKGTPPKSSKQEMAGVYSCKRPKSLLSHGRDFYTVSNTGFVQQWVPLATETFKLLGHTTGVRSCVVLPDSQYALTGGSDGDASVIIWDIKRASAINQLWDLDVFGVKDLGVLQFDNRVILAVGLGYNNPSEYEDNVFSRIVLWDLTDVHHPKRLSHIDIGYSEGGIGRFATTKKGNRLLLSTLKGDVRAYEIDVDNEILFREIMHLEKVHSQAKQPKVPLGIIDGVGFLDDEGKFGVTAGIDGKVVFIDIAKKHQTIITDLGIPLYSLSVSPEHDEFAVGDFNGCIQRWSVEWESNKPQFVKKIPFEKEHKVPVKALTYHSDNTATRLVSGDNVGDIRLWDTKTNSWVFSIEGQFGSVFDLEFSPNGYHLISTSGGFRGKENAGFIWDGVPWEQQARLFGTRVRTMQAKNIVNDLLYDRPKTLEQFLFAIDDKAAGEQISSEVIDEAKLQATFAFNVPKNWRLMWWAENILFDPTATKENLQIALHWTKTALASAPLRMDTNAIHALALARVGAFDESELSANRALELELFKEPIKRSPQISASIMVRIAKTIVATHRGDQVAADLMSIEADDLIATTMNSFTHATNLIAHLEKTSSEVVSQVE